MKQMHPTIKDLIDLHLGISSQESDLLSHLEQCTDCRNRFNEFSAALSASDNSNISPSVSLEERIRRSLREFDKIKYLKPGRHILKPALGIAAALVIAFTAFVVWYTRPLDNSIIASLKSFNGETNINEQVVLSGTAGEGAVIQTGISSVAAISVDKAFSVILSSDGRLKIIQLRRSGSDKPLIAGFYLEKGELLARFGHDEIATDYSFETQSAVIKSLGTEFMLKADSGTTSLIMIEGKVIFKDISGEKSSEAVQGMTYSAGRNAGRQGRRFRLGSKCSLPRWRRTSEFSRPPCHADFRP